MTAAFSAIADHYDLLLDEQRLARELPHLQGLLGRVGSVCDLGCGNGDHLAALIAAGWQGCGIDCDSAMVTAAKDRHPQLDLRRGDLKQPPAGPWDAIICLGNVLACLPPAELPTIIAAWRQQLAPSGRIIVHLVNPLRAGEVSTLVRRDTDRILIKTLCPIEDGMLLSLLLHLRDGETWQSHASHQHLHHHHPDELRATCRRVGFEQVTIHGGLDGRSYSDESPNLVLVAQLPEETAS